MGLCGQYGKASVRCWKCKGCEASFTAFNCPFILQCHQNICLTFTGVYTGAIYNDSTIKKQGFKGEGRTDGSVVVIKTHKAKSKVIKYDRRILLIRSPYEAMLSEFNRQKHGHLAGGHTGFAQELYFAGTSMHFMYR